MLLLLMCVLHALGASASHLLPLLWGSSADLSSLWTILGHREGCGVRRELLGGLSESPLFPPSTHARGWDGWRGGFGAAPEPLPLWEVHLRRPGLIAEDASKHCLPKDGPVAGARPPGPRPSARSPDRPGASSGCQVPGQGSYELEFLLLSAQESANPTGGRNPHSRQCPFLGSLGAALITKFLSEWSVVQA